MSQVPLHRTPIAMSDYARALLRAWRLETGALPTKQAAGVLWAQYMIETGGSACWCFNLGNVKVTAAQVAAGVPWFDLPGTWEIVGGKRVVLPEGDPGRRFRAYASLADAMVEHLRFLRNKRYKPAWPAVEAGDVMGFARMLKAAGYFTASAEDYGGGMMWHYRRWLSSTVYENARDEVEVMQAAETEPELPGDDEPTQPSRRPPVVADLDVLRKVYADLEFPPRDVKIPGDDDPDAA
jgi:hypothetical protein